MSGNEHFYTCVYCDRTWLKIDNSLEEFRTMRSKKLLMINMYTIFLN